MGVFINETYDLPEDPEKWAKTLFTAMHDFYHANGLLPHSIFVHLAVFKVFMQAMEMSGFGLEQTGFREDKKAVMKQMEEFADMAERQITVLIWPQRDFHLFAFPTDEVELMQFQLSHMDGRKQVAN